MSEGTFAPYLADCRLLMTPEYPDWLIFRLTTRGGEVFDFAVPKKGSAAAFGHLALDAQAIESGTPIPPKPRGQSN